MENKNQDKCNKNSRLYWLIPIVVIIMFCIYAFVLLWLTWPISELSINKSAGVGDSFGPLTSLFSGLAFSGMIITVLLQSNELKLQRQELEENRIEYKRSAVAHEMSARLSALSTLLEEYKYRTLLNDRYLSAISDHSTKPAMELYNENMEIIKKRNLIIQARQCAPHDRFLDVHATKIDSPRRRIKSCPGTSCVHLNCAQNPAPLEAPSNDLTVIRDKILATLAYLLTQAHVESANFPAPTTDYQPIRG